jgi:hypothetical protein
MGGYLGHAARRRTTGALRRRGLTCNGFAAGELPTAIAPDVRMRAMASEITRHRVTSDLGKRLPWPSEFARLDWAAFRARSPESSISVRMYLREE